MRRIEVTGHRGAAALEPENTLLSIQKAIDLRCDRVEIDVHHCRSGELVVIHDDTVDRTTNGAGRVADLSLEELRKFDAGKGERIPTLQEVIDRVHGRLVLQIELKGPGTSTAVVAHIVDNNLMPAVVVTSFHFDRVEDARRLLPELRVGFLSSRWSLEALETARRIGASELDLHHSQLSREVVDQVHASGLNIRAWNIDEEERMREVAAMGVDGIGSNRPDVLIMVLETLR